MRRLKRFALPFLASMLVFNAEARKFWIRNETDARFSIQTIIPNPRVTISVEGCCKCPCPNAPEALGGNFCFKTGEPWEMYCDVKFEEGYEAPVGEEPYISFRHEDNTEFRMVFLDENYVELRSDTATETRDDPSRRAFDNKYNKRDCSLISFYEGPVRHWVAFGKFIAICGYVPNEFALRSIYLHYTSRDNSTWMSRVQESHDCGHMGGRPE